MFSFSLNNVLKERLLIIVYEPDRDRYTSVYKQVITVYTDRETVFNNIGLHIILKECRVKKGSDFMCYTIDEIREKTIPIARTYGISKVGLFGSYARGEANDNSDIDLYIEKGKLKSLIQYFSFINELEVRLGCHVDVVTTGIEDKVFLDTILKEGIIIYDGK